MPFPRPGRDGTRDAQAPGHVWRTNVDRYGPADVSSPRPKNDRNDRLFTQILLAIAAGILTGVLFGEGTRLLTIVSVGFVRLLQVNVLPYLLGSLIAGLGARDSDELTPLARSGVCLLLVVWGLALTLVTACGLALPDFDGESVFGDAATGAQIDWLELYIPSNLFHALANNLVPAVVLFGVLAGVALGQVQPARKAMLLQALDAFNEAMTRVSRMILRLTPAGLFATTAVTAGSIHVEDVVRLQVWLCYYAGGALLLTMWVLPGLVARLTDVRYAAFLRAMRNAIVTAAAAGDALVVLPLVAESAKRLLGETGADEQAVDTTISITVPLLYNFPHAGKLLSLAFLPFAAWFSGSRLEAHQLALLVSAGPLSLFGNINAAVSFLLDLMRLPADLIDLFTVSSVVNSRLGSMVAAAHMAALAILLTAAVLGRLRLTAARIGRYVLVSAILIGAFLAATRVLVSTMLIPGPSGLQTMSRLHVRPPLAPVIVSGDTAPAPPRGQRLQIIRRRSVLRAGFFGDALPWAYVDANGSIVGYDIEAAHRLAHDLGTALEFVRVERHAVARDLESGRIDIMMSGFTATVARAAALELSRPYGAEHLGFLVRDFDRQRFATREALDRGLGLVVAVPPVEGAAEFVADLLPQAAVRGYTSIEATLADKQVTALLMPLERAFYWSRIHPELTAIRPAGLTTSIATVYAMPRGEAELRELVNHWLEIRSASGEADEALAYWIHGSPLRARPRRWSVIDAARAWFAR